MTLIARLIVGIVLPVLSVAQTNDSMITQEYFVQQAADENLLITINAFEAEFESQIFEQNGAELLHSGIYGSRLIPVFQYVSAPEGNRQVDIKVSSNLHTKRSEFGLELTRLKIWDDRSNSVSRAYNLLSFGMLRSKGDSAANWTVKIDSLVNAGRLFQQFGMQEMRMWSNYLAAHLVQFQLHDYSIVYSMTREILAELKGSRLQKIELATLQLQSAALIGLKRTGSLSIPANGPDPVQAVLSRTARLAAAMRFYFEQAQALYTSAVEYAAASLYTQALEQFQQAVKIADSVGDPEFATGIRERIVQIHALQGNTRASSEVLQKIETQLLEEGAGDELALNLLAQGRLFIRGYAFDQAIEVLYQALDHQNDSAIRRQINFELAIVFYETGRLDEAVAYLRLAVVNMGSNQQRRINPVVDMGEALRIMANIHRSRGEFAEMRKARSAQGQYQPALAHYFYDRGLDEHAAAGNNRSRAQGLFRQSHTAASETGQIDLKHLARLQFCALGAAGDVFCSKANTRDSYDWLMTGGVPRFATEAMYLQAQLLVLNGRSSEAITVMDRLVGEIHLLRYSLPGVLGAWYRERHEQLFEYYLDLLSTASSQQGRAGGPASLLALSKIRYIEKHIGAGLVSSKSSAVTDQLRVQLAQRAEALPGQDWSALNASINQEMAKIRQAFDKKFEYLSSSGLQNYLRSLRRDELVLTYHISATTAQVWIGKNDKVQRRNIANPAYIYSALQETRQGLAKIGMSSFNSKMEELGKRLIAPIADLLTQRIYWVPAGPLLGFPLDALRLDGRYLLEKHTVVNLLSFPANVTATAGLQVGLPQSVFLAGHPQDYSGDIATRLDTSAEIQTVADIFVGPGLHIVQGTALLPDEFQDEHFQKSELLHLSMPGKIDLKYPEQSSLELSEDQSDPGRVYFKPKDIQSQELAADLVFLSATGTRDFPLSGFSSQPGLVSDFIDAGANSVIARLWAGYGGITEDFITNFYHQLEVSGDLADSLANTKRHYLKNNHDSGLYDWAGYQLFID